MNRIRCPTKTGLGVRTHRNAQQTLFSTAISDWLSVTKPATARSTFEKYRKISEELTQFLGEPVSMVMLQDIDETQIRDFLTKKRSKSSASTVNLCKKILSSFFSRCVSLRLLKSNPCSGIKTFKPGSREIRTKRRTFTIKELKKLCKIAPSDFWRYMVIGGLYTGLRMGDLICLRLDSINIEGSYVAVETRKTGLSVKVPLNPRLKTELIELLKNARKPKSSVYLWPFEADRYLENGSASFSNYFYRNLLVPTGIAPKRARTKQTDKSKLNRSNSTVSFHCLRHTFVSLLKENGASYPVAKELVGHTSDSINDLYTHNSIEALAAPVKALPEI